MAFKLAIRADAIRLLLPYIGDDVARCINGIHLERHHERGLLAVAADGHKMGVAYDDQAVVEGDLPELTVKIAPHLIRELARQPGEVAVRWLVVDEQMARVVRGESALGAINAALPSPAALAWAYDVRIDGRFPNWRRAVPSELEHGQPSFNAGYLAAIAGSYTAVSVRKAYMRITGGDTTPALVNFRVDGDDPEIPEFFAVIMPVDMLMEPVLPAWLVARQPVAAE